MATSVSTAVEQGDVPLQVDVGLLASVDANPLEVSAYRADREELLAARTRNATQALFNAIFRQPIERDADMGPMARLPAFETPLPREKPLPKPKPLTKWERFARKKGITNKKKDKLIYDEERKEWVPRWGYGGANKGLENQWLVEVPNNADDDYRPDKAAAKKRKEARLHNESQRQRNLARNAAASAPSAPKAGELGSGVPVSARTQRRAELDAQLQRARGSTASLGRFDRALEGESKPRGQKRSFQPNDLDTKQERASNLALLAKIGGRGEGDVNMRKAINYASGGQGSKALASRDEKRPRRK